MGSNNNNETPKPTIEIINKTREEVCKTGNSHKTNMQGKCKQAAGELVNRKYKICYLDYASQTSHFYTSLNNNVGIPSAKQSDLVKSKIDDMKTQAETLTGLFKDTVANVKDTKAKFTDVYDLTCKMNRCKESEERCNPDIYKALEKGVPDIWERMNGLKTSTRDIYDQIKNTFDGVIKISGFLTFIDYSSLDDSQAALAEAIGNFNADIAGNMDYAEGNVKSSSDNFKAADEELIQTTYEKCGEATKYYGFNDLYPDLELPPFEEGEDPEKIEQICTDLSKSCHNQALADVEREKEKESQALALRKAKEAEKKKDKADQEARALESRAKANLTRASKESNKLKAEALELRAQALRLKAEGTRLAAKGDASSAARALKLLKESEALDKKAEKVLLEAKKQIGGPKK